MPIAPPEPATQSAPGPAPSGPPSDRSTSRARLLRSWAEPQNRNAVYLLLNNVVAAGTGLLFWLLITRLTDLPPATVGVGYTVISLGTIVGIVAKGGLDTALVRHVPRTGRAQAHRLLLLAVGLGVSAALILGLGIGIASQTGIALTDLGTVDLVLATLIGVLLVITWLQDAYFLADGDARHSFHRNLIFGLSRLVLPLAVAALALPQPVAFTWMLALLLSAIGALIASRRLPAREGPAPRRADFLRSAARNISGSAAEFVPGLLLAPLVLVLNGPTQAAYFGIAWTAASLLFLASSAISRSALAELVRQPLGEQGNTLRRGVRQHLLLVVPCAIGMALLSPVVLGVFGPDYARNGAATLTVLAASILVVAPAYYYLTVLRAREQSLALIVYPLAMILVLAALAPLLARRLGIEGVALAWFLANIPFALIATWKLRHLAREVTPQNEPGPPYGSAAHVE